MNKQGWLLMSLLILLLNACDNQPVSQSSPAPAEDGLITETAPPEISPGGGLPVSGEEGFGTELGPMTSQLARSTEAIGIEIPGTNEIAPAGILQQLAWSPKGGGVPDPPPCGECSVSLENSTLNLRGFKPLQHVWLLVYRFTKIPECLETTADYVTSLYLQVNENGSLNMPIHGDSTDLFIMHVYDQDSGEVLWVTYRAEYWNSHCTATEGSIKSCPGSPPQRLVLNTVAYVCTKDDKVKLREGPDKDYDIIDSLIPGTKLKVIAGPSCADNWSWWQVETENEVTGWMAEGGDDIDFYFLCPTP